MTAPAKFESTEQLIPDELAGLVANLDREGLLALQAMIAAKLAELGAVGGEKEKDTAPNCEGDTPTSGRESGRRWVELKMIRGFGPYAYERWLEGGRKRSRYIGKVTEVKP